MQGSQRHVLVFLSSSFSNIIDNCAIKALLFPIEDTYLTAIFKMADFDYQQPRHFRVTNKQREEIKKKKSGSSGGIPDR